MGTIDKLGSGRIGIYQGEEMSNLEIVDVDAKGTTEECLRLRANADIPNLANYVVIDSTFDDSQDGGLLSNKERHVYWFSPYHDVKAGDLVQLKTGQSKKPFPPFASTSGGRVHTFYWNLKGKTVWNKGGDKAVVLFINDFTAKRV